MPASVPFPSVRVNARRSSISFRPSTIAPSPAETTLTTSRFTLANTPEEMEAFLSRRGIPIACEMTGNFGAQGDNAHAFHVQDPDGNAIELHASVALRATDQWLRPNTSEVAEKAALYSACVAAVNVGYSAGSSLKTQSCG